MIPVPNGTFIGDDSRGGVYVLTTNQKLTAEMRAHIRQEWDMTFQRAGITPPVCMVLGAGMKLQRLEPADSDGLVPGAEFCAA